MANAVRIAVLCVSAAWTCGCATIIHGTRQTVTVTSDPSGAAVTVLSGTAVKETAGITPVKLRLPRRDAQLKLRLEKSGCEPTEVRLTRSVSGWTFGNLIAANPLAQQGMDSASAGNYVGQLGLTSAMITTDFLTGGAYKLPKVVDVRFCGSPARRPERF
jgi:hypothetical protein